MKREPFRVEIPLEDGKRFAVTQRGAFAVLSDDCAAIRAYTALAGEQALRYSDITLPIQHSSTYGLIISSPYPDSALPHLRSFFVFAIADEPFCRAILRGNLFPWLGMLIPLLPLIGEARAKQEYRAEKRERHRHF